MRDYEHIRAFGVDHRDQLDISILRPDRDNPGKLLIGTDVLFEKFDRDSRATLPTISLPYDSGQLLMDDLWNAGIRPTEGTGSAGSLKATENHLNDMRKIAFNFIEKE